MSKKRKDQHQHEPFSDLHKNKDSLKNMSLEESRESTLVDSTEKREKSSTSEVGDSTVKKATKKVSPANFSRVRYTQQPVVSRVSSGRKNFYLWVIPSLFGIIIISLVAAGIFYGKSLIEREQQAREILREEFIHKFNNQNSSNVITTETIESLLTNQLVPIQEAISDLQNKVHERVTQIGTIQAELALLKEQPKTEGDNFPQIQENIAYLKNQIRVINATLGEEKRTSTSTETWSVIEATYFLRIANEQLRLNYDINSALTALQLAKEAISYNSRSEFSPIENQLEKEINLLKSVAIPDINQMAMSLSYQIKKVNNLELKGDSQKELSHQGKNLQEDKKQDTEVKNKLPNLVQIKEALLNIRGELQHLVIFNHRESGGNNLSKFIPEERYLIYQNLQLKLEVARLSLIQRNEENFQEAIKEAKTWLDTYFQGTQTVVMQDTLAQLEKTVIKPPLPDIFQSLKMLNELIRRQSVESSEGGNP
ncbi:uroporphyrinogen-III C-methyltransferase [Candidatus Nitrosacidococcus tergens]|uniref:Uroporphyrinogen-III C-methyltransferase n=1 Tax=Candidatus Nitrosacidococcus tergens TaxID=553981 RepID=A0A7G1QCU5_9GAMM|nr:uroporphyrinogen-III C-methyltransferase [Candidatus Nitrosacidococcus tergens]CAB1277608.1 conserved protein of unknown function [Candidatus Nitrosacidococcus tergens]